MVTINIKILELFMPKSFILLNSLIIFVKLKIIQSYF